MPGWIVGVLVEENGGVVRRFFGCTEADQGRAEWLAADRARDFGHVASSPHDGHEPVETIAPLSRKAEAALPSTIKGVASLGANWPRRWLV